MFRNIQISCWRKVLMSMHVFRCSISLQQDITPSQSPNQKCRKAHLLTRILSWEVEKKDGSNVFELLKSPCLGYNFQDFLKKNTPTSRFLINLGTQVCNCSPCTLLLQLYIYTYIYKNVLSICKGLLTNSYIQSKREPTSN